MYPTIDWIDNGDPLWPVDHAGRLSPTATSDFNQRRRAEEKKKKKRAELQANPGNRYVRIAKGARHLEAVSVQRRELRRQKLGRVGYKTHLAL